MVSRGCQHGRSSPSHRAKAVTGAVPDGITMIQRAILFGDQPGRLSNEIGECGCSSDYCSRASSARVNQEHGSREICGYLSNSRASPFESTAPRDHHMLMCSVYEVLSDFITRNISLGPASHPLPCLVFSHIELNDRLHIAQIETGRREDRAQQSTRASPRACLKRRGPGVTLSWLGWFDGGRVLLAFN